MTEKPKHKRLHVKSIDGLTLEQIKKLTPEQIEKYTPYSNDIIVKTEKFRVKITFSVMQDIYINMKFFKNAPKQTRESVLKTMISSSAYFNKFFSKYKKQRIIEDMMQEVGQAARTYIETEKYKPILENYY